MMGACTDLDEVLVGEHTETFDTTEPDFGSFNGGGPGPADAMSSAFGGLRPGSASNGGLFSLQSVSTDEMAVTQKGGDWYDGGAWISLHRQTAGPTNDQVVGTWNDQYNAIGSCNSVLASGDLNANQTAQVRVLRAYYYYRLMDLYGRVKIVTTPGVDAPQATRAQVFAFVESEIKAALGIAVVTPAMDLSGSDLAATSSVYRVNHFGALGLLAKVYLNAEVYTGTPRYAEAAIAAGYVIDNGGYVLCGDGNCVSPNYGKRPSVASDPDELTGYATVFAPDNFNSPEMIWSIAYDHVNGGGMNFQHMTLHYSSQFTWNMSSQPWNGFSVLEDFYNSYDNNDKRKAANFIVGPQLDYEGSSLIDYAATDGNLEIAYTPEINELEPNANRVGGARMGKFSFRQGEQNDMDNDYPIVRLGEMYLVRAEGAARAASDWSLAAGDVNTIRARAGLSAMGSITADSFLAERGREMFQESTRRQDLIRFGKYNDAWWEKPASQPFRKLFPIPQGQIDASGGTLTQNPGY
jgi:hypothetical protein